jgi:hypothetical protein
VFQIIVFHRMGKSSSTNRFTHSRLKQSAHPVLIKIGKSTFTFKLSQFMWMEAPPYGKAIIDPID